MKGTFIFNTLVERDEQAPIALVANHTYTISLCNWILAESYSKVPFPPFYVGTNFKVKPVRGYEVAVTTNTTWTPR